MFDMFLLSAKPCVPPSGCNVCICVDPFSEEHEQLQQLHSGQKEEHEGVVLKLQSQLRSAHYELDRVRGTLRTLEGADGHG